MVMMGMVRGTSRQKVASMCESVPSMGSSLGYRCDHAVGGPDPFDRNPGIGSERDDGEGRSLLLLRLASRSALGVHLEATDSLVLVALLSLALQLLEWHQPLAAYHLGDGLQQRH